MAPFDIFKYILMAVYVGLTLWLSWVGMRKTKDMKGFAIGNKDMGPYLIGITMAASIASTSTFVINPGFVYVHGVSAFIHYALAGWLGIATALILLTRKFHELGESSGAITIPDWIYKRYQNRTLSLFFAFLNLMSIAFVVLILVGCSILFAQIFNVDQKVALVSVAVFVFGYVFMGGTYAHAYTNAVQGVMMVFVAIVLVVTGFHYLEPAALRSVSSVDIHYAAAFNTNSTLYYDFFSVFLSSFIVSFALMLQPHILTKVLYLKDGGEVKKFLGTSLTVLAIFMLMLLVGFYARLSGLEIERQDMVVAEYISQEFSGTTIDRFFLAFVTISLLAAGMSTLDGILVALSSMIVRDIYLPLTGGSEDTSQALWLAKIILLCVGLLSVALAWNPPQLVGLFAQKGVYGLAVASFVPIVLGVLLRRNISTWVVAIPSIISLLVYLTLLFVAGVDNPAVAAAWAILGAIGLIFVFSVMQFGRSKLARSPV